VIYGRAWSRLAQASFKRMIAYHQRQTHMGYILLAVGGRRDPRPAAAPRPGRSRWTGAVTQMVSHGFAHWSAVPALRPSLYERGGTYDMAAYSGLAGRAPVFCRCDRGRRVRQSRPARPVRIHRRVPDLHRQPLRPAAVATAVAVTGILITAAPLPACAAAGFPSARCGFPGGTGQPKSPLGDLTPVETAGIVPLLALAVVIGIVPRFLLDPHRAGCPHASPTWWDGEPANSARLAPRRSRWRPAPWPGCWPAHGCPATGNGSSASWRWPPAWPA